MPIYSYCYVNSEGQRKVVEHIYPMSSYPSEIWLEECDEVYRALLIPSLTAKMATNWDAYEPSDLPPIRAPMIDKDD